MAIPNRPLDAEELRAIVQAMTEMHAAAFNRRMEEFRAMRGREIVATRADGTPIMGEVLPP